MEEVAPQVYKETTLEFRESHQDYVENEASDYESVNSDAAKKDDYSDYDSDAAPNAREEGDGQESVPPKRVDDDEDKKNPQYIPKRGTFYEHDDRTLEENEEEESADKKEKDRVSKKSIWIEKERWGHDRYNENEQVPKSQTELIGVYGYDIRNEDGPPRARRRRRYGRGPNKYTRTWEDEDAYRPVKPVKPFPKKTNRNEEFPPLGPNESQEDVSEVQEKRTIENQVIKSNKVSDPAPNPVRDETKPKQPEINVPSPKPQPKDIKAADYSGFTKVRQYKNSNIEQKIAKKPQPPVEGVQEDLAKLAINKKPNRQNAVPPRLQNEQKGSKRYSSLRQRNLPETAAANTFSQQTYYANDYTPPQPQQAILTQPPPPQPVLQQIPPNIQPVPVTANALLPTPTQFGPPFPAAPAFISAAVTPSPFIQPQPQIINYVPSQPQFAQAQFPGFQHQQFNAVSPAPELNYQYQGGTTYYSTQNQQLPQVPLQRRPKAAIPIVPPPPQERHDIFDGARNDDDDDASPSDKEYDDFYGDYDEGSSNIIVQ